MSGVYGLVESTMLFHHIDSSEDVTHDLNGNLACV